MRKILVLFAHPKFEQSFTNKVLIDSISSLKHITLHDLYEVYPDFNIDIEREKALLLDHQIIVWHHPFYWYSCPPLLKQWIDLVLEFDWAYGPNGTALQGKYVFNTITTGGAKEAYQRGGRHHWTLHEFLTPFAQTAQLCRMIYLPPFAVQGTHLLTDQDLMKYGMSYQELLTFLGNGQNDLGDFIGKGLLNEKFVIG